MNHSISPTAGLCLGVITRYFLTLKHNPFAQHNFQSTSLMLVLQSSKREMRKFPWFQVLAGLSYTCVCGCTSKKTHCEWNLHHKHKCCTIQKMKRQCCDAPAMCEMVLNEMKAKTPLVFVDGFCTMTTSTTTCQHHHPHSPFLEQHFSLLSCTHNCPSSMMVYVQHRNPKTVYNHNHQPLHFIPLSNTTKHTSALSHVSPLSPPLFRVCVYSTFIGRGSHNLKRFETL